MKKRKWKISLIHGTKVKYHDIQSLILSLTRVYLFHFCFLIKGLSAQRKGRDVMFQQCNAIRQDFKDCLRTRPKLAQFVLHHPDVQNLQKKLKDALDAEEKHSSKDGRQ